MTADISAFQHVLIHQKLHAFFPCRSSAPSQKRLPDGCPETLRKIFILNESRAAPICRLSSFVLNFFPASSEDRNPSAAGCTERGSCRSSRAAPRQSPGRLPSYSPAHGRSVHIQSRVRPKIIDPYFPVLPSSLYPPVLF